MASIGIAALAAAAVVAGLWVAGGPVQARKERRDDDRRSAISALSSQIDCLARDQGGALPSSFGSTESCPAEVEMADPHGGAPLRVEPVVPHKYRICADFELPPDRTQRNRYPYNNDQRDGDCIVYTLPEIVPARDAAEGAATGPATDPAAAPAAEPVAEPAANPT